MLDTNLGVSHPQALVLEMVSRSCSRAVGSEGLWPQLVRCAPFPNIALYFTKARLSRPKVPDV
jgi:hypothetical protein